MKSVGQLTYVQTRKPASPFYVSHFSHAGSQIPIKSDLRPLRLKINLGLKILKNDSGIEISRARLNWSWEKVIIVDYSFEHFVWSDHEGERTIFILDIPR